MHVPIWSVRTPSNPFILVSPFAFINILHVRVRRPTLAVIHSISRVRASDYPSACTLRMLCSGAPASSGAAHIPLAPPAASRRKICLRLLGRPSANTLPILLHRASMFSPLVPFAACSKVCMNRPTVRRTSHAAQLASRALFSALS